MAKDNASKTLRSRAEHVEAFSLALRKRWIAGVAMVVGVLAALALGGGALDWIAREAAVRDAADARVQSREALLARVTAEPLDGTGAAALAGMLAGDAFGPEPSVAAEAFAPAAAQLLQAPEDPLRLALLEAVPNASRTSGLEHLAEHGATATGAMAAAVWRAHGALSADADANAAIRSLERALETHPQEIATWRLLAELQQGLGRSGPARGAGGVADGLELAAQGDLDAAQARWREALPRLRARTTRAFVLGQLGDAAAERRDFAEAEARYREALKLSTAAKDVAALSVDASKLARVLQAVGRAGEACRTLEAATEAGGMVSAEERAAACPPEPTLRGLSPTAGSHRAGPARAE